MKRIDDMTRWTKAALDTPFQPAARLGRDDYPPGICVKSCEFEKGSRKFFGRVVEFDKSKNYALVRSYGSRFDGHGGPEEAGVLWEGTVSECLAMWEID